MNLNKHRIAWIGFAVGIVLVILITWMAAVSPCLDKIHNADEQTAQIEAQNEKTQKKIDQLMIASETMTIQRARLKQLQAQLPENFDQSAFITSIDQAAAGTVQPLAQRTGIFEQGALQLERDDHTHLRDVGGNGQVGMDVLRHLAVGVGVVSIVESHILVQRFVV